MEKHRENKLQEMLNKSKYRFKIGDLIMATKPKKDDGLMRSIMSGITIVDKLKNLGAKIYLED